MDESLKTFKEEIALLKTRDATYAEAATIQADELLRIKSELATTDGFKRNDNSNSYTNRVFLLEAMSVHGLPLLGEENVQYKVWLESFEQIISELRPHISPVLEFIRSKKPEQLTKAVFIDEFSHLSPQDADNL